MQSLEDDELDIKYTIKISTPKAKINAKLSEIKTMSEEKPKTGKCEFDVKRQLWIVYNGKEWVEVDLKKHRCNFNDENINKY